MFENTPSDRVQVRHLGSLQHPGACALCGSGNCEAGYVDTGVYYEYEGYVYFCMNCAYQIVNAIGCLLPDESAHLREVSEGIAKAHKRLEEENANLRDKLTTWNSIIADAAANGLLGVPIGPVQQVVNDRTPKAPRESATGESVVKESTPQRRPNDAKQSPVRNRQLNL